ncbi:sec-independent protein translocase protein TatA [Barrientosiimonas humi]|uniref:Sec-independent protein translocase protein TatA n=1 Tax=Barrientosiimonas humi TaxID=999931 RepID=A0A542XBB8_9MICO|nr:twin-arginine translocase TatA/TatE family subunit [Barrientosiimonas humi]TQL33074.1 sec-independent protein translocase protein TatA [Barrientosiimonas humi]CAG7573064.1 Sec-independent protein translocase protein TatA [Barrientosiimonas humi]
MARLFDNPMAVIILVLIIVVVFGWKRLPDAARSLGRSTKILKSELGDLGDSKASRETVQGETRQPGQGATPAGGPVPGESAPGQGYTAPGQGYQTPPQGAGQGYQQPTYGQPQQPGGQQQPQQPGGQQEAPHYQPPQYQPPQQGGGQQGR